MNPEGPSRIDGITIVRARGNDLSRFADGSFDTVLCNSVLEHEPRFWEVLSEARRVLRP
ncbi:MAG: class I SAM-dependent methyltransferase, partial [Proteobacteria bacterium]|nr:class I SAM-dependent methyltransferase [Pseudomonadota bacterium]